MSNTSQCLLICPLPPFGVSVQISFSVFCKVFRSSWELYYYLAVFLGNSLGIYHFCYVVQQKSVSSTLQEAYILVNFCFKCCCNTIWSWKVKKVGESAPLSLVCYPNLLQMFHSLQVIQLEWFILCCWQCTFCCICCSAIFQRLADKYETWDWIIA